MSSIILDMLSVMGKAEGTNQARQSKTPDVERENEGQEFLEQGVPATGVDSLRDTNGPARLDAIPQMFTTG